ncbi:helix-turn-helix domain-containing protein [Kribbella sp. HUAS MG21]|uniref:Helix-turn-helix domain-containing protein n=1 Tax=Kribbella sp. HUAS MG21 TaxID=3160966 RepID=A0AAU7TDT8_9ACTN
MASTVAVLADLHEHLTFVTPDHEPYDVSHVAVLDGSGTPQPGALVAAVGVRSDDARLTLLRSLADVPVAGVVFAGPWTSAISDAVAQLKVTVGVLHEGASWAGFIAAAHSALHGPPSGPEDPADQTQRLFQLTDQVAELLEAALIVEDDKRQVVAHSSTGGPHDAARTRTILGRQMPPDFVSRLRATGAFRRLTSSDEPFVVPAVAPDFLQRIVIPLRLGPEAVGSIWAIRDQELDDELRARLLPLTRELSVCLLRLRAQEDLSTRYSVERVRAALNGTEPDADLVLPGDATRVVALGPGDGTSPLDELSVWRAMLRRHSWAYPILTEIDGTVFALVTDGSGPGSWEWLRSIGGDTGLGAVSASRPARSPADLPARRVEAAEVAEAAIDAGLAVASYQDVWSSVVLRKVHRAVPADVHDEVRALLGIDARGDLAGTLGAWLLAWGDYAQAAVALDVHPNTVRLRMRRILELLPTIDLDEPSQRLALTLVLTARSARSQRP